MDPFYDRLIIRAATIDELLSDDFEVSPAGAGSTELAQRRHSAWCRSAASGDQALFARRLKRDGLDSTAVLSRLASSRRRSTARTPLWAKDAVWIVAALAENPGPSTEPPASRAEPVAFEHLLAGIVGHSEVLLKSDLGGRAAKSLQASAYDCLRRALFKDLSDLIAAAVYERFSAMRRTSETAGAENSRQAFQTSIYDKFIADMKGGGFRRLFEDKPVMLRLISTVARQWIDTSREFILRLDADLPVVREVLRVGAKGGLKDIEGGFSDPHNGGRSVKILTFDDGSKIVYKPKDLRIDVAWQNLIERLNRVRCPTRLMTANAIARDGYGWTTCIEHSSCAAPDEFKEFFRRVGAWLALFHCLAANDMHQENLIAAGSHPIPVSYTHLTLPTTERV